MKKISLQFLVFLVIALLFSYNGLNSAKAQEKTSHTIISQKSTMMDVVVKNAFAQLCLDKYKARWIRNKTVAVGFNSRNLESWLHQMNDTMKTNTDTIRIYLGVYSKKAIKDVAPGGYDEDQYAYDHIKNKKNRFSVFLYPYHGNQRATYKPGVSHVNAKNQLVSSQDSVEAFNLGNVYP